MKYFKSMLFASASLVAVNANAFEYGDLITFDPGIPGGCTDYAANQCNPPFLPGTSNGSYAALDLNRNGKIEQFERIPLTPGFDGGIILGYSQNISYIDQWSFFNAPGHHQTGSPVIQSPDGTLDFSGWQAFWNGIYIDLGNGAPATLTCSGSMPCTVYDNYVIDYTTTISNGLFSGYRYTLHLSKGFDNSPELHVNLAVTGGNTQECNSVGGNTVVLSASVTTSGGAQLHHLEWSVDGSYIGTGSSISPFLALGGHTISVKAIGVNGIQSTSTANVIIKDTTRPVISADFIDSRSGSVISTITTKNTSFVEVGMSAYDICDASPTISGIGGFSVIDGDLLKIQGNLDKVELTTSSLKLSTTSKDVSGNSATLEKTLSITP
jgi:hypothetical protein